MKPVPILLAAHRLDIGGSERQLTEIAKALDRSQWTPHVCAFHATGIRADELKQAGIPVLALPVRSFKNASAIVGARILRKYVREHGIRLIHSFDVPLNIFVTVAFAMGRGPVVLTSQRGHRTLSEPMHQKMLRIADRLTDGIVVNCEYMRQHLIGDEKVRPELIDLCYNGVDTEAFSPGATPQGVTTIGTVCALRPEKDLPTLMRAFATVRKSVPSARLVIVGSGPAKPEPAEGVTFEPTTANVVDWLRRFDIFVLPSRTEALSNAIIEAMACGVCVIASNVGGNPELTGANGERGLLFPVGDDAALAALLLKLAGDQATRKRLATAARAWVCEHLSLAASAARMGEIYDQRLRKAISPSRKS